MAESSYRKLAERLDMNITGVPKKDGDFSEAFIKYLGLLFTPEEAEAASYPSVEPKRLTIGEVAEKSGRPAEELKTLIDGLAERGVIIGVGDQYMLPVMPLLVDYHPFKNRVTCPTDALTLERMGRAPNYPNSSELRSKVAAELETPSNRR